jgi:hypothetical protein
MSSNSAQGRVLKTQHFLQQGSKKETAQEYPNRDFITVNLYGKYQKSNQYAGIRTVS